MPCFPSFFSLQDKTSIVNRFCVYVPAAFNSDDDNRDGNEERG